MAVVRVVRVRLAFLLRHVHGDVGVPKKSVHVVPVLRMKRDADQREELQVDVKDVLNGKKPDVALQGDDILFIPGSTGKKAALRTLEAAIQTGTGMAIWRVP